MSTERRTKPITLEPERRAALDEHIAPSSPGSAAT